MARIYFRLPQCLQCQDRVSLRQCATITCGISMLIVLLIFFIQSRIARSENPDSDFMHALPTLDGRHANKTVFSYGPDVHYGIVLDCGSSGTRVYVYIWPPHSGNPSELLNIQQLKNQFNEPVVKKIEPGLATFASHPHDASEYLKPLLRFAEDHIPKAHHSETLLYILATAGMRMLPETSQKNILQDLQRDIPKDFNFVISETNFEVISGKLEGVYAWIAVNYVLQKFGHGEDDSPLVAVDIPGENLGEVTQHVRRRTVGMLDMGGGSMQIAFELTANLDKVPKHMIAEFNLGCQTDDVDHSYRVYVTTFLGYGANEGRSRYEAMLISRLNNQQAKTGNKPRDRQGVTNSPQSSSSHIRMSKSIRNKRAAVLPGFPIKEANNLQNEPAVVLPDSLVKKDNSPMNKRADVMPVEPISPVVKQAEHKPTDHDEVAKEENLPNNKDIEYLKRMLDIKDKIKQPKIGIPDIPQPPLQDSQQGIHNVQPKHLQLEDSLDSQPQLVIPHPLPTNNVPIDPYKNIPDPCLQRNLTLPARDPRYADKVTFRGTGNYIQCQEALIPLLNLSVPCEVPPCSMNGVHQPSMSFHNSEFYGFSEFWYTMEDVFRIGGLYEHGEFQTQAMHFCDRKWTELMALYNKDLYKKADPQRFRIQCFKSAWMTTVLHKGLHFPESYKNLNSVQFINNKDVQWTLGALIHRTRYLPLRDIEKMEMSHFKPSWIVKSHFLYNEYLILVCFFVVVMAILLYIKRLRLCSQKQSMSDLSRVPSMSYFMTDVDQVEQGVKYSKNYLYP